MEYKLEKDLFAPLKKYFNEAGYKVFTEVPNHYRCIDFVAVKGDEQIAVEMKMHFNIQVIRQAGQNVRCFQKSYIAVPTNNPDKFVEKYRNHKLMQYVLQYKLGMLLLFKHGNVVEFLEGITQPPHQIYDFSTFEENEFDEAGLPFQKGKSTAFIALDRIKKYVTEHPHADWKEIYDNVQTHYASHQSLRSSMTQWKGFSLEGFKHHLFINDLAEKGKAIDTKDLPLFETKSAE